MISDQVSAFSKEHPSEALSEALAHAIHQSEGAAHTHVIVQDVISTGTGWKAILNYYLQPKLPGGSTQRNARKAHVRAALQDASLPTDEAERRKVEQEHRQRYVHDTLEEQIYSEIRQIELAKLGLNMEPSFIHLYIKDSDEALFRPIENNFNFDSVHVLSGPLWEEANRRHPDLEMYEAAHNMDDQSHKTGASDSGPKTPRLEDELVDKLSFK